MPRLAVRVLTRLRSGWQGPIGRWCFLSQYHLRKGFHGPSFAVRWSAARGEACPHGQASVFESRAAASRVVSARPSIWNSCATTPQKHHQPAMCGIFFSLARNGYVVPDAQTAKLLRNRGPDHTGLHQATIARTGNDDLHATFLSTVLSLRGTTVVAQPLHDESTGSVLCWNGEAWSIRGAAVTGNDAEAVFHLLLKASHDTSAVIQLLSQIRGPYAVVFYDAVNKRVFYGRDCLGRRSLLTKSTSDGSLVLSSVCDNATGEAWTEVEADGIYVVDCKTQYQFSITHVPHARLGQAGNSSLSFVGKCLALWYLLTSADPTIPTHEPRYSGPD